MELWYSELHTENTKFSIRVKKQLHHVMSPYQEIDFFDSEEFGVFFTLDGLMMVNEKDEFIYHDMIVHVPMAVNPKIKKVLVIGGGDGGTVRELTKYLTIDSIHLVEIDKMVVDSCKKYLKITSSKLNDPRVTIFYEDGVDYVEKHIDEYDLILIDSTDPIGPGEGLFTRSFYRSCYKALTDEGILINQHESPYYDRDKIAMKRAHERIKEIFKISDVYQFHMPTYPSGHWLFGFASKKYHPLKDIKVNEWESLNLKTKYYNTSLHKGAFALPNYVLEELKEKK